MGTKAVSYVQSWVATRRRDDEGATMVEYGLMVGLIAAICVGVVTTLGTTIQTKFQAIITAL